MLYSDIEPMPIAEEAEEALISLLEKYENSDTKILFVASPWPISKKVQQRNLYIKDIIEGKGYTFLDMNHYFDEIGIDFSVDFYDALHTNVVGSEKVSKFFGQYLLDNYDMNLEHSEAVVKERDAAYAEYDKDAEEIRVKAKMMSQN